MSSHLEPPSSERYRPPSLASISASPRSEFAPTDTPMRPHGFAGKPSPSNDFQVVPPSPDLYRPLPGPPLLRVQGVRYACHREANRILGLFGSKLMSMPPVLAS